jgi:hypothetical protein
VVVCLQPNLLNFEDPALNLYLLTLNITDTTFWFTVAVEVDVQDRPEPPTINDTSFSIAESDSGYPTEVLLGSGTYDSPSNTRSDVWVGSGGQCLAFCRQSRSAFDSQCSRCTHPSLLLGLRFPGSERV